MKNKTSMTKKDVLTKQTKFRKSKKDSIQVIDVFFRDAYRTQLNLTSLADNKANIMISVNGLIITALIATEGLRAINSTASFQYILLFVLMSCATSMAFAILTARPKTKRTKVNFNKLRKGKDSALYFNNFIAISEDEYVQLIDELTSDRNKIYQQMSRHIYNLGIVLARKYRLLKYSYLAFLFGMTLAILMFILNFMINT